MAKSWDLVSNSWFERKVFFDYFDIFIPSYLCVEADRYFYYSLLHRSFIIIPLLKISLTLPCSEYNLAKCSSHLEVSSNKVPIVSVHVLFFKK